MSCLIVLYKTKYLRVKTISKLKRQVADTRHGKSQFGDLSR